MLNKIIPRSIVATLMFHSAALASDDEVEKATRKQCEKEIARYVPIPWSIIRDGEAKGSDMSEARATNLDVKKNPEKYILECMQHLRPHLEKSAKTIPKDEILLQSIGEIAKRSAQFLKLPSPCIGGCDQAIKIYKGIKPYTPEERAKHGTDLEGKNLRQLQQLLSK